MSILDKTNFKIENGRIYLYGFQKAVLENINKYPTYADLAKEHSKYINKLQKETKKRT